MQKGRFRGFLRRCPLVPASLLEANALILFMRTLARGNLSSRKVGILAESATLRFALTASLAGGAYYSSRIVLFWKAPVKVRFLVRFNSQFFRRLSVLNLSALKTFERHSQECFFKGAIGGAIEGAINGAIGGALIIIGWGRKIKMRRNVLRRIF